MSLDAAQKRLLRSVLAKRSRAEAKRLFAAIRGNDDRALFAALAPKKKAKRAGDPFVRELELLMKPLLASAAEKADMLIEHAAKRRRRKFALEPKGLAEAVRGLRAAGLSDDQIRAVGESLMREIKQLHGDRETVV
jgi:hypothetical protein